MSETIENKVAKSGLITVDLEAIRPSWNIVGFDIADCLWERMALKEKDFRAFVSTNDWSQFTGKAVFIHCSVDAIIPTWAYMLLSTALSPHAEKVIVGNKSELELSLWRGLIGELDMKQFNDQRVILKGCSDEAIHESIYLELTALLTKHVKSLMFGEPCSTVPIFKRK